MTSEQIVQELKSLGQDSYKKVLLNHGATYIKKVQQRGAIGKKRKTAKCWVGGIHAATRSNSLGRR
jgi:hypothetical protein